MTYWWQSTRDVVDSRVESLPHHDDDLGRWNSIPRLQISTSYARDNLSNADVIFQEISEASHPQRTHSCIADRLPICHP